MITYQYTAKNPKTGQVIHSTVQADSEAAASKLITSEGLVATNIRQGEAGFLAGIGGNKVKVKDRVLFSRQLSTLINAGLPLLQALRSVNSQSSKQLQIILTGVIGDVEGGSTLAKSMSKYPKVFNQVYLSLIAAGESSGTLDKSLDRLAIQQEKEADLNSKIRGAMIYPLVVLFVMIAVVGFMVVKVLPSVETLYEGMSGARLPTVTVVLLWFSHFVMKYWLYIAIVVVALAFMTTKWARTGPGKEVIDMMKMKAWPIGSLFMKVYMARFSRTGTTLVTSGVPLLQVLNITARAVNNVHIEAAIMHAADKVKTGKSLAESIENNPNFLPLVPNMVRIGEQSGSLEQMLEKIADYYEKEVDTEVANISSIIEPVMMIMLGIVAFIIVAAVLLPVYSLAGNSGFQV